LTIEEFIRTQIGTVDCLRALLLLQSDPGGKWDLMTVSGRLYLPPEVVSRVLETLRANGLLGRDGDFNYYFQPRTPELAQLVEELVQLDREQPVSLINLIYARPEDVSAFADAFRIRKKRN
jgi:hypothetical protein